VQAEVDLPWAVARGIVDAVGDYESKCFSASDVWRRVRWAFVTSLAGALMSCQRSPAPESGPTLQATAAAKPAQRAATTSGAASSKPNAASASGEFPRVVAARYPGGPRIVAIGDLHGDLRATRDVLQLVGAIDAKGAWVGGNLIVVQTGDQLDRGDDEREILDLLENLRDQAKKAGGAMIVLNGNHELMNAQGDFRYVTPGAVGDFRDVQPAPRAAAGAARVPPALAGRAAAFFPGGKYARLLASRETIAIVGDSVFAHGGVHLTHVRYGIDRINSEVSAWLNGKGGEPSVVVAAEGPVWSRAFSLPKPSDEACEELGQVLAALGVKRMIVGHTVQEAGITSACGDRVWRIDVGMSSYYRGREVMALQVRGDEVEVLRKVKTSH